MLVGQNSHKTGNNAVKMSQEFCNIARFERVIDLILLNMHSVSFKTEKWLLYNFM